MYFVRFIRRYVQPGTKYRTSFIDKHNKVHIKLYEYVFCYCQFCCRTKRTPSIIARHVYIINIFFIQIVIGKSKNALFVPCVRNSFVSNQNDPNNNA